MWQCRWDADMGGTCVLSVKVVSDSATLKDCSMPGSPVLHHLLEFVQIHVHWVDDAI